MIKKRRMLFSYTIIFIISIIFINILLYAELLFAFHPVKNSCSELKDSDQFDDLFSYQGIYLDLDVFQVPIGWIAKLEISNNENVLILDDISNKLWLIIKNENKIIEVNPRDKMPGIRWRPKFISFSPDGFILVIAAPYSNSIFLFAPDGSLIKKVTFGKSLLSIRDFCVSNKGEILVSFTDNYYQKFAISKLIFNRKDTSIVKIKDLWLKPNEFASVISRSQNSILCCIDNEGNLYQAYSTGTSVNKYSHDMQQLFSVKRKPAFYHALKANLRIDKEMAKNRKFLNMLSEATKMENIFYLNCGIILLQYIDTKIKGTILDFLTTEGHYLSKGNVIAPIRIMAVQGDCVFAVKPIGELHNVDDIPNPKIIYYRLKYNFNMGKDKK